MKVLGKIVIVSDLIARSRADMGEAETAAFELVASPERHMYVHTLTGADVSQLLIIHFMRDVEHSAWIVLDQCGASIDDVLVKGGFFEATRGIAEVCLS